MSIKVPHVHTLRFLESNFEGSQHRLGLILLWFEIWPTECLSSSKKNIFDKKSLVKILAVRWEHSVPLSLQVLSCLIHSSQFWSFSICLLSIWIKLTTWRFEKSELSSFLPIDATSWHVRACGLLLACSLCKAQSVFLQLEAVIFSKKGS
jgi:hypothetical protein